MIKLNKFEKGVLLAIAGLTVATCVAKADLGDTYENSCTLYGVPHHKHGKVIVWVLDENTCVEATFDDPNKRCDSIRFEQWGEPIMESTIIGLIGHSVLKNDGFREETSALAGTRVWISLKNKVHAVLTTDYSGQRTEYALTIFSDTSFARYTKTHPAASQQVLAPSVETLPEI